MPPAEPSPDFNARLLARSPQGMEGEDTEEPNIYSNWKAVADELKLAGYPMNLAASEGVDQFSADLKKKARLLDVHIEYLVAPLLQHPRQESVVDEALLALRTAICQGLSKQKFQKLMNEHNFSLKCSVIWESDAIAYRCNTCSKTPCMSLCATCFKGGDHEGHDVTRFFSREGGACDCGNEDVLKASGFCSKHGDNAERPPPPPVTIVSLSELILLRVLMLVLDHFRKHKQHHLNEAVPQYMMKGFEKADQVCGSGKLIALLQECVDYGGPIRDAFARILISREIYSSIWAPGEDILDNHSTPSFRHFREKHKFFEQVSRESLSHHMLGDYFKDFPKEAMKNACFLHELLFWMRVHIFPQSLINLTLVFLGDTEYRDEFARRFFLLYPWTSDSMRDTCLNDSVDYNSVSQASSRIIHISVQMLSSSALCSRLTDEINLPKLMFGSVAYLLLSGEQRLVHIKPLSREQRIPLSDHSALDPRGPPVWAPNMRPLRIGEELDVEIIAEVIGDVLQRRREGEGRVEGGGRGDERMEEDEENEEEEVDVEVEEAEEAEDAVDGDGEAMAIEEPDAQDAEEAEEAERLLPPIHPGIEAAARRAQRIMQFSVRNQDHGYMAPLPHESTGYWYTLDVDKSRVLHNHGYWFVMGDTQNLLSHPEVVSKMCRDQSTMKLYFSVIEKMQCMDMIKRETGDHLLNERPDDYQRVLVLEYEMSASSMFNIVFGIITREDDEAAANFFDACWTSIKTWITAMDLNHAGKPFQLGKASVSFHLPLSRHLATLLSYAHKLPSIRQRLEHLMEEEKEKIHVLLLHPLRLQAARAEWSANMWIRNGQQMRIPAFLYAQTHMLFSYYMPDVDLLRICAANMQTVDVLHALFESYSLGDVFRWKKPESGSGVVFHPQRSLSLRRIEWVDTLVFGCLRLIADLVFLPGVGEQSNEDSMRDDIVCKLAISEMPHSRLRQSIAEKGSHGAELVDQFFEKILAEVAVFSDPEIDESLDQGVYSLSTDAQLKLLCPLLVMGRSTSPRYAASAMQRMEIIERRMAGRPEHQVKNVWTPYRLLNFEESIKGRAYFNKNIYRLIAHERLLETLCYILDKYKSDSDELENRLSGEVPSHAPHEFIFKEQTIQMVIYLLSNSLLYMRTRPEQQTLREKFHKDFSDYNDTTGRSRTLAISILSIGSVLMTMNLKRGEISKEEEEMKVREMMREAVKGEIKERIIAGTPAEYYGRLLAILYRDDERFRAMLNERYPEIVVKEVEMEEQTKPVENTPNTLIAKKRAAAEALRQRIIEDKKRKGEEMMKKLMEKEQMTQEDLDRLDVSDQMVEQYECPICGDETPASFDQPIGLLVYVQFNGSYLNSVDASLEDKPLVELDEELQKNEEEAKSRYRKHARYWREVNSGVESMIAGDVSEMISTPLLMELKTCGHHAHINCLSQYRETIFHHQHRDHHHPEVVLCPKCRFPTNGLLSLKVKTGVEMNVGETLKNSSSGGRLVVFDTLMKQLDLARKAAEDLEEHEAESPSANYSMDTIQYLISNNPITMTIEKEAILKQKRHVLLQGLLVQNVERNLLFDGLGVTPVRPKCIDIVSEHLNFHSALSFTNEELDITMDHVRELMMDEPQALYEEPLIKTTEDPMEGPSGMGGSGGMDETNVRDLTEEDWQIFQSSRKRNIMDDPDLSADMQCALTSPRVTKTDRWNIFHKGIPTSDRSITKLTRVRVGFSLEWKKRCEGKKVMKFVDDFATVFSQPFALATRLTSVMMSSELTKESILESMHVICRRLVVLATVRWTLIQMTKVDLQTLREYADEGPETDPRDIQTRPPNLGGIRRVIARVFCSQVHLSTLAKTMRREELPSFDQYVLEPMKELMMRIAQLWHEVRLVSLPEGMKSALGMTKEQLERHVLGPSGLGPLPSEFVLAQWTLNSVLSLTHILHQRRVAMEEPCTFRPFLTLRLPESYDDIFARYFGRTCRKCGKVPQHPMICLICSEMICLDRCCAIGPSEQGEFSLEPEDHPCGVHIPFLALNSALIVIVKLKVTGLTLSCRAQIWGSVYLDAHGEEDRNLRRGKPLKLAQKRVERLYRDFLEGDVESKVPYQRISTLATALRDSHYLHQR